jgi:hypothetical protein
MVSDNRATDREVDAQHAVVDSTVRVDVGLTHWPVVLIQARS